MKLFALTVALAGIAVAAPLNAQVLSRSRLPSGNGSVNDGSWYSVGRDNSGNTIYERRTYDNNGNVVIQRARRDSNGNFVILSSRTVANGGNNTNDCTYNRTTNSVGDIIFGRGNVNTNCNDRTRVDGGWYQVGRGANNNSIYERRTRDGNGNVIIQRARRNSDGSFTILSTRNVGSGNGSYNNGRGRQGDKEWEKQQKRQNKEWKKEHKNDRDDDDNSSYTNDNRGDNGYYQGSNAVARGNGKGRDHKGKH